MELRPVHHKPTIGRRALIVSDVVRRTPSIVQRRLFSIVFSRLLWDSGSFGLANAKSCTARRPTCARRLKHIKQKEVNFPRYRPVRGHLFMFNPPLSTLVTGDHWHPKF